MKTKHYEVNLDTGKMEYPSWGFNTEKEAWKVYKSHLRYRRKQLVSNIKTWTDELNKIDKQLNRVK